MFRNCSEAITILLGFWGILQMVEKRGFLEGLSKTIKPAANLANLLKLARACSTLKADYG